MGEEGGAGEGPRVRVLAVMSSMPDVTALCVSQERGLFFIL